MGWNMVQDEDEQGLEAMWKILDSVSSAKCLMKVHKKRVKWLNIRLERVYERMFMNQLVGYWSSLGDDYW